MAGTSRQLHPAAEAVDPDGDDDGPRGPPRELLLGKVAALRPRSARLRPELPPLEPRPAKSPEIARPIVMNHHAVAANMARHTAKSRKARRRSLGSWDIKNGRVS